MLATINYHDGHGSYPSGYISNFTATGQDTGPGWGWGALILPQLEQGAIHRLINFNLPVEDAANSIRLTPVSAFLCPADDIQPMWAAESRDAAGNPTGYICDVAPANYVAMYGTSDPGPDGDGMFFRNSRLSVRDIRDGVSQTIALGERSHRLGEATWTGSVTGSILFPDADEGEISRQRVEHSSGMVLGHSGDGHGPGDPRSEVNQFFSQHGPGANFAFGDGHVSFLVLSMDYKVYRGLTTRAGNEAIKSEY